MSGAGNIIFLHGTPFDIAMGRAVRVSVAENGGSGFGIWHLV